MAAMEDVLEVYKRPYNPDIPMICMDETNRQLIEETRRSIPVQTGQPKRIDYEYRRNGVVNLFMMFEPLGSKRFVRVRDHRTRQDWALCMQALADDFYPSAEKILLVSDNLNTHTIGSFYEAFSPPEARRLAEKFEIHYTPKHGSWLNMAEIEIGILSRQCLSQSISTKDRMVAEVTAWQKCRNRANVTVDWQFTTADARIKLKKLYPEI